MNNNEDPGISFDYSKLDWLGWIGFWVLLNQKKWFLEPPNRTQEINNNNNNNKSACMSTIKHDDKPKCSQNSYSKYPLEIWGKTKEKPKPKKGKKQKNKQEFGCKTVSDFCNQKFCIPDVTSEVESLDLGWVFKHDLQNNK